MRGRVQKTGLRIVLCGWLGCCGAAGATDGDSPPASVLVSTSRRFVAHGPDPAWNLILLLRVERMADRLESLVGSPLPAVRGAPMRFVAVDEPDRDPGVRYLETFDSGRVHQRVFVLRPEDVGRRRTTDMAAMLMLSRYARETGLRPEEGPAADRIPDWLAVGVADYLFPELRLPAYGRILEAWAGSGCPPLEQVLSWTAEIDDDPLLRAAAVTVVGWLAAAPDSRARIRSLLELCREGRPDRAGIRSLLAGSGASVRAAEIEWQLWVASLEFRAPGIPKQAAAAAEEIRRRAELPGILFRAEAGRDPPDRIGPRELLVHRGEPWVPPAANRMSRALSRMNPMSLPAGLRGIPPSMIRWLQAVAGPEPGFWSGRRSSRRLAGELDRMAGILERAAGEAEALSEFLDRVEEELGAGPEPEPGGRE